VVLSIGVLVIHVAGGTVHPAPTWIGKMSTVFQMATVLAAMASGYLHVVPPFTTTLLALVTAGFTVTSGLQYIVMGLKQLEAHNSVHDRV
jgi:phosphatidylglycerophosphate synthase